MFENLTAEERETIGRLVKISEEVSRNCEEAVKMLDAIIEETENLIKKLEEHANENTK